MNPIVKYVTDLLAKSRILGNGDPLVGLAHVDAELGELINGGRLPGMAITVLKKGDTIFEKGFGMADLSKGIPVEAAKTIFRVASISKPIAATALANMVHEGIIDLEASLYRYVPYFPKKRHDFTIRQLAAHMAGIRTYRGKEYASNHPYTIREGIALFKDDPLEFEPGTDYRYTSYDWVLLSLAMQEASGIPFAEYVEQKVLKPLGMQHTFPFAYEQGVATDLATFYTRSRGGFREAIAVDNTYKLAGGGYLSTSMDIAKFGQAYLDGQVLDAATIAPFLKAQDVQGRSTFYGLGWQVSADSHGRSYFGHVGNSVGAYTNLLIYPKEQMVVVLLTNCTDPNVQEDWDGIIHTFLSSVDA